MNHHDALFNPASATERAHRVVLTRRAALASALAAMVVVASGADKERTSARASDFPVTVEHKYGSTMIASPPARVVTYGPTDEDTVLALGLVPVGLTDWWDNYAAGNPWPWAQPLLAAAGYAVIPLDGETHYEEIIALDPDLIIGQYTGMTAEDYERLSQIAPTVAQSGDYEDWRTPWQVMSRTIAAALGKPDDGERLIAEVEEAFADVRETHPHFADTTVLYVERGDGTFTIRGANEPRVQVLTNMGLQVPAAYTDLGEFGQEFSDEQMYLLDEVDVVVWMLGPVDQNLLLDNTVFQNLRVTKENRNVFVTDETLQAAINWSSVLSLPYAAEHLSRLVADVL